MGWLDAWERRAREAIQQPRAEPLPVAKSPPRPAPEIKTVWIQTAYASSETGDPGAATVGYYSVSDGMVTMHDEGGKPTGKAKHLGPNDNPRVIAGRLTKAAWLKERGESNFNRRLSYPRAGCA